MSAFDQSLAFVLKWEGGLVNDSNDPGGLTNHGISQRAYPGLDIRGLTKQDVVSIYQRDYWEPARCGEMPAPVALVVFDSAVNQGVSRAVQCIQAACGESADGIPGPRTMEASRRKWQRDPGRFLRDICHARLMHYTGLSRWDIYGSGWGKRLLDCLRASVEMMAR
jgi:lysozyme family protein